MGRRIVDLHPEAITDGREAREEKSRTIGKRA